MNKIWIISAVFIFALMSFEGSSESSGLSHIKTNMISYVNTRFSAPEMKAWIEPRLTSIKTSGASFFPFSTRQYFYYDNYVLADFGQYNLFVDFVKAKGWDYEPAILHAKTDYTSANANLTWSQADKFDRFENAKGVMKTSDDVSYTDLTSTAYNGSVTWQKNMYIGYELPFDQINVVISTAGTDISKVWEYWNGAAWTSLTITDGTSSFANSGQIAFTPPSNWSRKVVNNSRNKYFVRCRITAATTNPVSSSIKGDTWLRAGAQLMRGWNATDSNIINAGTELEYNPSPPAGSSAKFPYQARITAWSNNHFVMNPGNIQNGVRPWSQFVASVYIAKHALGFEAFGDDQGGTEPLPGNDDFVGGNTEFIAQMKAHVLEIHTTFHAAYPNAIFGGNYYTNVMFPYTDFALIEGIYTASRPGDNRPYSTNLNYDNFDPSIIPYNPPDARVGTTLPPKFGIIIQSDLYDSLWPQYHANALWDRSNRGPMTTLAKHYILQNPNTVFEYQTMTGFIYNDTDEVYYLDPAKGTTITSPIVRDAIISSITYSGTTATVTTAAPHGYSTGNLVRIEDAVPSTYNVSTAAITVVDAYTFTYTMSGTPTTNAKFVGQQWLLTRYIYGVDFSQFPSGSISVKIDDEVFVCSKVNNTTLLLQKPVYSSHNAGATIRFSEIRYLAKGGTYSVQDVHHWGKWFPAIETDVGIPDTAGYNGGVRKLDWIIGPACGTGRADVWRRDYTNAIVLLRTNLPGDVARPNCDPNNYRSSIDLGGTYYRLCADGTTGPAITTISLRDGEGAILMKGPVVVSIPPKQSTPPAAVINLRIVS